MTKIPDWAYESLLLSLCLNSCINPIIYGAHYYTDLSMANTARRWTLTHFCSCQSWQVSCHHLTPPEMT